MRLGSDPVGQLSRLNGLSSQATWTVHVSDLLSLNSGG
jgi:hypothetical protein